MPEVPQGRPHQWGSETINARSACRWFRSTRKEGGAVSLSLHTHAQGFIWLPWIRQRKSPGVRCRRLFTARSTRHLTSVCRSCISDQFGPLPPPELIKMSLVSGGCFAELSPLCFHPVGQFRSIHVADRLVWPHCMDDPIGSQG